MEELREELLPLPWGTRGMVGFTTACAFRDPGGWAVGTRSISVTSGRALYNAELGVLSRELRGLAVVLHVGLTPCCVSDL